MSVTVAIGATEPSGRARSLVSTGTQDPSARCTRVGTADDDNVDEPSGFANACETSLRPDNTSTGCPHRFAIADALAPSGPVD